MKSLGKLNDQFTALQPDHFRKFPATKHTESDDFQSKELSEFHWNADRRQDVDPMCDLLMPR